MSPPAFSASLPTGPRVRALSVVLLGLFAVRGVAQEARGGVARGEAEARERALAAALSAAGTGVESGWSPPPALAGQIRLAVAERWGTPPDSLHIEWEEPAQPLKSGAEMRRLLGPGRAGSWIALLGQEESRGSIRFRAGMRLLTPVARIDFGRGRRLSAEDIEWTHVVSWGPPAEVGPQAAVGWITRRPIAAGDPLVRPLVAPPAAVRSGEAVTVRWTSGRVTIDVPGEAIGEAALGETVLVRLETGLRVRGTAADSQTVILSATGSTTRPGVGRRAGNRRRR